METNILLEQASEHVKKVNKLMGQVEDFETVLNEVNTDDSTVCIYSKKETIFVDGVLNPNIMSGLKVTLLEAISSEKLKTVAELEKLLGTRKAATLNPEFEKAILEMEEQKTDKLLVVDSGTAKCVVVQKEPDKPEMTPEEVERLYIIEGKTLKEVADHFGVKKETLNSFMTRNGLKRKSYSKNSPFKDAEVEAKRKERP